MGMLTIRRVIARTVVSSISTSPRERDGPHPTGASRTINKDLEQIILDTFSLQIINEYDLQQGKKYPPETIKPHPYMATRYLQTQHRNKQGKTSGDGRSIWNGYLKSET